MLVLTRKVGEEIIIGHSIRVSILSCDRGYVKIGIEAPRTVPVYRKEIYDRIMEYNKKAAQIEIQKLREVLQSNSLKVNRLNQQGSKKSST